MRPPRTHSEVGASALLLPGRYGRSLRVPRSDTSRREQLKWQLDVLDGSIARYDAGYEYEAMRIAIVARIRLYDGGTSTSLLAQLGVKAETRFVSAPDGAPLPSNWGILVAEMPKDRAWRLRAPVEG